MGSGSQAGNVPTFRIDFDEDYLTQCSELNN